MKYLKLFEESFTDQNPILNPFGSRASSNITVESFEKLLKKATAGMGVITKIVNPSNTVFTFAGDVKHYIKFVLRTNKDLLTLAPKLIISTNVNGETINESLDKLEDYFSDHKDWFHPKTGEFAKFETPWATSPGGQYWSPKQYPNYKDFNIFMSDIGASQEEFIYFVIKYYGNPIDSQTGTRTR